MKKVVLFGLLGALGCLAGWAAGEPLLRVLIPWAQAQGAGAAIVMPPEPPPTAPSPPGRSEEVPAPEPPPVPEPFQAPAVAPPPAPSADFADRLAKAGAGNGPVQIALSWSNRNDLDLHVIEPTGNKIWAHGRHSPSGGELDVDSNFTGPSVVLTDEPVEHINYRDGAPEGHYWVYVSHYFKRAADPTKYKVGLFLDGRWKYFEGAISHNGPEGEKPRNDAELAMQLVCEFDVKHPGPELRLSLPAGVAVARGGTNRFQVKIARDRFEGPVTLSLSAASKGVTIDAAPIPAGATSGFVMIRAEAGAPAGGQLLRVMATGESTRGRAQATEPMKIEVLEPPKPAPVLKLSVPEQVEVYPDGKNEFRLKIGRYFFPEETRVKVRFDTAGAAMLSNPSLTAREITLGAGETEATMEVAASAAALTGIQRSRLIAEAETPAGIARAEMRIDVLVVPAPPPPPAWPMALVMGIWTALLALGLSLALAMGQNRTLHQPLVQKRQAAVLVPGSIVAGGLAGAGGQLLYTGLGQTFGGSVPSGLGQMAGWLLLGALLGGGIAFYIPNLPRGHAALAGAAGGFVGVVVFLVLTASLGAGAGRFGGAIVLGFTLGAMVALVQVIVREAWLEVSYGPNEVAEVSLGATPITIGSDAAACTVYTPDVPPIASRYELTPTGVLFTDVPAGRTNAVPLGAMRQIGKIGVTVRGVAHRLAPSYSGPRPPAPRSTIILPENPEPLEPFEPFAGVEKPVREEPLAAPPLDDDKIHVIAELAEEPPATNGLPSFVLRLSDGAEIELRDGLELSQGSLAGLRPLSGEIIAKVARSQVEPDEIGFRNLSSETWKASGGGHTIEVQPGQNVRLTHGCQFDFGPLKGEVRERAYEERPLD